MADDTPTTGPAPETAAPPTAETPVAPGAAATVPPTAETPATGWAPTGGAVPPPGSPYAPTGWVPYWGPPPGGVPYPTSAPPPRRPLTMSRLAAVLGALAILVGGVGVGIGIGAAVWSGGTTAPAAGRFPRIVTPTGSIHIGGGRHLPITGSITVTGPGGTIHIGNGKGGQGFARPGLFGGTTGTVTKVSGTTVTIKQPDGSTVTVKVPSSAKITVTKPGATSDLASGACVRIAAGPTGPPTPGGSPSVNARAVQVLPGSACPSS